MSEPPGTGAGEALLVDLYELTMAASYFAEVMFHSATFELFVRDLPPQRNFLVACGLEPALRYLETLRFSEADLDYLRGLELFEDAFLGYLEELRFTGEVWAVPEGDVVFPSEPLLRVTAGLIEAQVVETYLLNCVNFSTMIASKAARVAISCRGRPFVDFSARRDHGADAALFAARAAFIGGAAATSNVLAGRMFSIPVTGTMAHSYVAAFSDEADAFTAFARRFPKAPVLLIDTYDTLEGARRAASVADELAREGIGVRAVRIDSGDLGSSAFEVRRILDAAGHPEIEIFASGDLDEYRIEALLAGEERAVAPIDGFGVGTQLGTSGDVSSLGTVYKLVEDASGPRFKLSPGKATLPGKKQVYRLSDGATYREDLVVPAGDPAPPGGRPLLERVMAGGRRLGPYPGLVQIKERCRHAVACLPEPLRSLRPAQPYRVTLAPSLLVRDRR
ncbi:MAG: nicotinate phosphoribosyltransferase [Actinomycetota bacterium]